MAQKEKGIATTLGRGVDLTWVRAGDESGAESLAVARRVTDHPFYNACQGCGVLALLS